MPSVNEHFSGGTRGRMSLLQLSIFFSSRVPHHANFVSHGSMLHVYETKGNWPL